MWIAISLMIIAVSFLVLVIFLIVSLLKWNRAVESVVKAVRHTEEQLAETLREVRLLASDVREKTGRIEPLLQSLRSAGTSLQELSTGLHQQMIEVRRRLGGALSVVGAVMEWFLQRQGPRDK